MKLQVPRTTHLAVYTYALMPPEKGPSDRFRRQYGSKAFIRVMCDFQKITQPILDFLNNPVVIHDRGEVQTPSECWYILLIKSAVFRAFRRKDNHVLFVQTSEVFQDGVVQEPSTKDARSMPEFLNFLRDFNDMEVNISQVSVIPWACSFFLFFLSFSLFSVVSALGEVSVTI